MLRLLAHGSSNRQIAVALVLSNAPFTTMSSTSTTNWVFRRALLPVCLRFNTSWWRSSRPPTTSCVRRMGRSAHSSQAHQA